MTHQLRVRFAPSPTGYLHVGGARTAIFNWLYARSSGGSFFLRIEDTDRTRSSEEMTREIIDGLRWLGIEWEGEPWIQSAHVERHRAECLRLHEEGKAYYCFCTQEELDARRKAATGTDDEYRYDRLCLFLSDEEREAKEAAGLPKVLRFKVPDGETHFHDIVHEETTFDNREIEDFVILRSDGSPVYQISVVVDDYDMGVTHVLRGDDHLPNTPKQVLLYKALGYDLPMFGHVPLILGADKKRLSKRHGATSVGEYQTRGYLPEALFNYLAFLGWNPGDEREIMTREELIEAFDVTRLLKSSSVFDEEKLRWMNGKHLRLFSDDALRRRIEPYIPNEFGDIGDTYLERVIPLMKERIELLPEVFTKGRYFFEDPQSFDEGGMRKHVKPEIIPLIRQLFESMQRLDFTHENLETLIRGKAEELGMSAGKVIHPIRLALTGGTNSPGLFELMEVLGKETCLRRLERWFAFVG